jgi:hypothetical protein
MLKVRSAVEGFDHFYRSVVRRHILFLRKYFFVQLLTEKRSYGMMYRAWVTPAMGMRMQRRRLPLGLLSR